MKSNIRLCTSRGCLTFGFDCIMNDTSYESISNTMTSNQSAVTRIRGRRQQEGTEMRQEDTDVIDLHDVTSYNDITSGRRDADPITSSLILQRSLMDADI